MNIAMLPKTVRFLDAVYFTLRIRLSEVRLTGEGILVDLHMLKTLVMETGVRDEILQN